MHSHQQLTYDTILSKLVSLPVIQQNYHWSPGLEHNTNVSRQICRRWQDQVCAATERCAHSCNLTVTRKLTQWVAVLPLKRINFWIADRLLHSIQRTVTNSQHLVKQHEWLSSIFTGPLGNYSQLTQINQFTGSIEAMTKQRQQIEMKRHKATQAL